MVVLLLNAAATGFLQLERGGGGGGGGGVGEEDSCILIKSTRTSFMTFRFSRISDSLD